MDAFEYRGKTLFCEDVKTEDIIGDVGTPTYIYSKNAILARYSELKTAFSDVDAKTHIKTTTGKKENKFGIDFSTAEKIIRKSSKYSNVNQCGLHVHLGSPIYTVDPYVHALKKV